MGQPGYEASCMYVPERSIYATVLLCKNIAPGEPVGRRGIYTDEGRRGPWDLFRRSGRDRHTSDAYHRNLHPDGDGSTGGLPGADGADLLEGGGRDHHRYAPGASGTSFWKLTGSGGAYTLTATNAIDYELPAVGGPGIYLSMLLGTGAMCAAGLFFATQIAGNGAGRGKGRY